MNEKNLKIGTIDDLQKVRRTVLDPSGFGANVIPGDVLWSDPSPKNGLSHNDQRGIGLLFGPDCTQEFMEKHKLKVQIIRLFLFCFLSSIQSMTCLGQHEGDCQLGCNVLLLLLFVCRLRFHLLVRRCGICLLASVLSNESRCCDYGCS